MRLSYKFLLETIEKYLDEAALPDFADQEGDDRDPLTYRMFEPEKTKKQIYSKWDLRGVVTGLLKDKFGELSIFGVEDISTKTISRLKIVFRNALTRYQGINDVRQILSDFNFVEVPTSKSTIPMDQYTYEFEGATNKVQILWKFRNNSTFGNAYEHIMAYTLSGLVTPQLLNYLYPHEEDPSIFSTNEVSATLQEAQWSPLYNAALRDAEKLVSQFGTISNVVVQGGTGAKGDLRFYQKKEDEGGAVEGEVELSIKFSITDSNNIFIYNKDMGYGDEEWSLIRNPRGEKWYQTFRRLFFEAIKDNSNIESPETYDPRTDDDGIKPPRWMIKAYNENKDIVREVSAEIYSEINRLFVNNIINYEGSDRERIEFLAKMIVDAYHGAEVVSYYDIENTAIQRRAPLYKLNASISNSSLEEVPLLYPNNEAFALAPEQLVQTNGSNIIIKVPGMQTLVINSFKFRNNAISTRTSDLRIKTRA